MKLSIRFAMATVVGLAVAIAALRDANDHWAGAMLLGSLLLLGVATLAAIHSREGGRAWWLGFAIFQGGYLLLVLGLPGQSGAMPTSRLLGWVTSGIKPSTVRSQSALSTTVTEDLGGGRSRTTITFARQPSTGAWFRIHDMESFNLVGHCTFAGLAGLLGAAISRRLWRRSAEAAGAA